MRRVFLVTITVIALGVALAGAALANAGPHGGYTALEDKCASCHRAHTAVQARLLASGTDVSGFCSDCHDGTGANTDVLDGSLMNATGPTWTPSRTPGQTGTGKLLGGGFQYYGGTATGSSHNVSGILNFSNWQENPAKAWGYGVNPGSSASLGYTLNCASCHDPHGTTNYAILRKAINTATSTIWNVSAYPTRGLTLQGTDGSGYNDGDATNRTIRYTIESYGGGSSYTINGQAASGFNALCGACHTGYLAVTQYSGSGAAPAGVFTHRVGMDWNYSGLPTTITVGSNNPETDANPTGQDSGVRVPLADYNNVSVNAAGIPTGGSGSVVICLTCHLAHGTTASMGSYSQQAAQNKASSTASSALLRLNSRGVCQACHQKS